MSERSGVANVTSFGAVGDGKHDDTSAIQRAIEACMAKRNRYNWSTSGGGVYFPPGAYKTTAPIHIDTENITLFGDSGPTIAGRNTWLYHSADGPLFRFPRSANRPRGFTCRHLLLVGQMLPNSIAFEIQTGTNFRRNFLFDRIGVSYFRHAFCVRRQQQGDQKQIGKLTIQDSEIRLNDYIIEFQQSTSCNQFEFRGNDAGNNSLKQLHVENTPAMDMRLFSATIRDNILEGQKNAVYIRNSEDVDISGNFFEGNTGDYAVRAYHSNRVKIGQNRFFGESDHMFQMDTCTDSTIDEPPNRVVVTDSPTVTRTPIKRSGPPSEHAWNKGDIVYNQNPTAPGNIGWVCVRAGTPGVWKRFGVIDR